MSLTLHWDAAVLIEFFETPPKIAKYFSPIKRVEKTGKSSEQIEQENEISSPSRKVAIRAC